MADTALIRLEGQPWLERAAERVRPVVTKALDAAEEIGGNPVRGGAARAAIGVGLAGALGAAVTGAADWQATDGTTRNLGLVHRLLNLTAASLYAASWAMRGNGQRHAGRGLSSSGFAIAVASAYIGGKMVYRDRAGIDHAQRLDFPRDFPPVLAETGLAEGQMRLVSNGGARILPARCEGAVHAIGAVCSHLGGPRSEGKLEGCQVECPRHRPVFPVKDGTVIRGPAAHPQARLETRIQAGQIEVRLAGPRI